MEDSRGTTYSVRSVTGNDQGEVPYGKGVRRESVPGLFIVDETLRRVRQDGNWNRGGSGRVLLYIY